ncbi:MAG: hypothetical protein V4513_02920 [Pseudomonadota bacterium]
MSALRKVLAGGVVAAALVSAAPAAAQIYPGYGSPYGYGGGDVVSQVIGQVLGGGMGGYGAYGSPYGGGYGSPYGGGYGAYGNGINQQAAVSQCVGAVQARLDGRYSTGYGYNQYGNNGGYTGARVLGISRVEPRNGGGLNVRGVANSGRAGAYSYTYGAQAPVDLTFTCRTDFRGYVTDVDVDRAQSNYGSNYQPYNGSAYGTDYSAYGYRRY